MGTRFEVGDVITGKQIATGQYSVTIRGAIMKVVEVDDDMIRVRVDGVDEDMASIPGEDYVGDVSKLNDFLDEM